LVRAQRESRQADHHALVVFAGMPRQRERVVRVVAVLDVGDRELRLEDGGLEGQGLQARRASSAALPMYVAGVRASRRSFSAGGISSERISARRSSGRT